MNTRGHVDPQAAPFTTLPPEKRVRKDHPIQTIEDPADGQPPELSPVFEKT